MTTVRLVPLDKRAHDDMVESTLFMPFASSYQTNKLTKGDNMNIYKKDNGIEVQYTTKKGKCKNLVFTSRTKFVEFLDKKLGGLLDD